MLTLTEAWKKSYSDFLDEAENNIDNTLVELVEATQEINKGFDYIQEYFSIMPLEESIDGVAPRQSTGTAADYEREHLSSSQQSSSQSAKPEEKKKEPKYDTQDITNFLMKQLGQKIIDSDYEKKDKPEYEVQGISTIENISDMKFPKNVIFFIQQLIAWIKRVVIYFIEKIKNIFRAITGQRDKITELNPDALKLKLSKVRQLESVYTPSIKGSGKEPVKLMAVKAADMDRYYALQESWSDVKDEVVKAVKGGEEGSKKIPVIISIDISKDLMNLKELIQHFYDLYDNAFGSNNEEMFKTDDLELILGLFKETIDGLKDGDIPTYQIGSTAVEVSAIDSSRVRDNLIRTNTNIESLKKAYVETSNMIKNVSRIITHKEMLMLSGYGIDNKWLSSSTYEQMYEILKTMKPRIKEAQKNEKALTKMQRKYEEVSNELLKMQRAFNAFANVSYNSVYQRRIVDMCNAAKYMTQTVTLRLTALGMYSKEMKDIRDLLVALETLNKKTK